MMKSNVVKTITAKGLRDFLTHLHRLVEDKSKLIYRGQKHSGWQIQSAFYRFCHRCKIPLSDQEEFYERFLSTFFDECGRLNLFETEPIAKNQNSAEALAQHYGLPTRFVDWSASPYIAAFFAFAGNSVETYLKSQHCALFVLDERKVLLGVQTSCRLAGPTDVQAIMRFSSITAPYTTRFSKFDNKENKRIRKQLGALYSVPLGYPCFEDYLVRNKFPDGTLIKIKVPMRLQVRVLAELRAMRINGGELYNTPEYVAIDTQHLFGPRLGVSRGAGLPIV